MCPVQPDPFTLWIQVEPGKFLWLTRCALIHSRLKWFFSPPFWRCIQSQGLNTKKNEASSEIDIKLRTFNLMNPKGFLLVQWKVCNQAQDSETWRSKGVVTCFWSVNLLSFGPEIQATDNFWSLFAFSCCKANDFQLKVEPSDSWVAIFTSSSFD